MDSGDYTFAWIFYLASGVMLSWFCWIVLRKIAIRELAILLQLWLIAILFTPWYVLPDADFKAPALMIFVMDAITINVESGIRALIPLVIAMLCGVVITLVYSVIYRFRKGRQSNVIIDSPSPR